ncbi:hypothetical protein M9H77_35938 [Catharanthus roseus]|uniref:Uncharacterized protein n=1 Tax=Catharanthus roseus TaxID=4058 RepID=A0ACB9ZR64_CATRO|nr:hypothetical protein M9H77_35938 [Catharanthus roseus]
MAPVATGIGLRTSIEEDPSEVRPPSQRVVSHCQCHLSMVIACGVSNGLRPLDVLVASILRQNRCWIEYRNMSGSQSPNHANEVVSESSQNRQSEPIREATPCPEQATHKVIENFMIKMIELLETSMATRRNERVSATVVDEALERFLKFRPPGFYGEVEQEIKYTAKFNRLTKYYLRLIDSDENKTQQFVKGLRVELQRALALLPPMGFAAAVEAATQIEMVDQAVIQRKTAIGLAATPYKRPGQGPWKPRDFKRSRGGQRTGNEGRPTLTPEEAHRDIPRTSALRCNKYLRRRPKGQANPGYERNNRRKE